MLARIVAAGDHVTDHTVRLLKPGHLEEDCPVTKFLKTKDSRVVLQKDQ